MSLSDKHREGTNRIINSGVSRHLSARRDVFEDYIKIITTAITIGNGKEITVVGQGNISLQTTLVTVQLVGVLHVPDVGSNLVSVASIFDQGF